MGKEYPSTTIVYEMMDGEARMTLQMHALYQLWKRNKEVWDDYNGITTGKSENGELDTAKLLYAAYLCACYRDGADDRYGSFEEFLMNLPPDRAAMRRAYQEMCAPKKARPSATLSKSAPVERSRKSRFRRSSS
ncbi:hypothetical protein [Gordonibacter massiliensis (ex Traore et al. 2017)]|uniref:hypothetical protein n=1 Tax=Gordonibacter massiliensis (ex Traore et al. 2017) TaxID=1841863 RepID=UPI001C8B73D7|nr:hypothetical protein [Gordonibacter massiliensis (ex Traore et al. 2017)]MBX9032673.1 hypothetical protein [Gordonibacter massiliensis (ex Traore et al. 2017)]